MKAKPSQPESALEVKRDLACEIREKHGEDVSRCYQCLKCSAGCPMTFAMDIPPSQVIRLVQLGQEEMLLKSKTIWVCVTCNTCSVRCPNDIDIALVVDALRERAVEQGRRSAMDEIALFHKCFLDNVKSRGRTFEGGLMGSYKVQSGQAFQNMTFNAMLGMKMVLKGRMGMLPEGGVSDRKAFQEIYRRVEERGGKK